mgnify:CR=1 FL=1|jgi:hypothetical protein
MRRKRRTETVERNSRWTISPGGETICDARLYGGQYEPATACVQKEARLELQNFLADLLEICGNHRDYFILLHSCGLGNIIPPMSRKEIVELLAKQDAPVFLTEKQVNKIVENTKTKIARRLGKGAPFWQER